MSYLLPYSILDSAYRFPEKEAFTCGQQSLSYAQMAERMNQLAALLYRLGVRKGDRVGIYLNRCLETAVAMYGIMRAGAIYVPLDPRAPSSRTQFLIRDCGIEVMLSHPSQKRKMAAILEADLSLKAIIGIELEASLESFSWGDLAMEDATYQPPFPILEQDPAYIIYTSGSTGQPKGIMHSHYSGLSYAKLTADLYSINEQDRLANHAPIHFDISTLGYFTAPLVGASTVILSDAHTILPGSLGKLIEEERFSIWYSVPLALTQLLQSGILEQIDASSLRWVLYAGEAFPPKYLRALMEQWSHSRFGNIYGPAEVNQCTYYHLPKPPEGDEPIPIGHTWGNTEYLILDEEDQEVPVGTMGELLIRSATMMSGYWQKPALTARSLYRKKTSTGLEAVYYRTGDLFKLGEDGLLHFFGRKDAQVKVRGYRVEMDAIEVALVAHEAVSEAAVFALRNAEEVNTIQAAVILNPNIAIAEKELLQYLKSQLPFYAIPENIHIMDSFPRTSSGKISRPQIKAAFQVTNS